MFTWNDFVQALRKTPVDFEFLKVIQLAQAILESGRGESELFKLHGNPFGMKYRPEMEAIAEQVSYTDSVGETDTYCKFRSLEDAVKGYWQFIGRSPYKGWRENATTPQAYIQFIARAGYVGGNKEAKETYIQKVLKLIPEAQSLLGDILPPPPPTPICKGKGVLLEVGHGPNPRGSEPGAIGVGGIREYDLNWIAAKAAQEFLIASGVPCTVTDFGGDSSRGYLYQIGQTAAGYDVFCSFHHNSAESTNVKQRAEVLIHNKKGTVEDMALAKSMSAEIAQELGIRDGGGKRQALGVLSGAEDTDVPVAVLAELYFIHIPVPDPNDWSKRGGQAVGRAILKWLKDNSDGTAINRLGPGGLGLYIVQPGDTLAAIASRHGKTLEEVLALNPSIKNANRIYPGQQILVARVENDDSLIDTASRPLNLPVKIAESQLNSSNYQKFSHPVLGNITITGGYMEPYGHARKRAQKAIYLDGTLEDLPADSPGRGRNIGIDYHVADSKVKAWYGGTVTKQGREGGYGRRVHLQLDVTYEFEGQKYQVYQAFAHLQDISVSVGQVIEQGQTLGVMGGSGASSDRDYRPHVDLSTYLFINGELVQLNPQALDEQLQDSGD